MQSLNKLQKKQQINTRLPGQYCTIESINWEKHQQTLLNNLNDPDLWIFIPRGQSQKVPEDLKQIMIAATPYLYVIKKKGENQCIGMFLFMKPNIEDQAIQLGLMFCKKVQRTIVTTEAFFLICKHAIQQLCFNRFFWRCHNLNQASKQAAVRFGFYHQGILRERSVILGAYQDNACFSILRSEWPLIKGEFQRWLSKQNVDENGQERSKLKLRQIRLQLNKNEESS